LIRYYALKDGKWAETSPAEARWIRAVDPTADELHSLSSKYGIDMDDLCAGLDEYEMPRFSPEKDYSMLFINTSKLCDDDEWRVLALGIAITPGVTITISSNETELVNDFVAMPLKDHAVDSSEAMLLRLLLRATELFIRDLYLIDKRNTQLEDQIGVGIKNSLILNFLTLEKSLVYLRTAVNGNQLALEKLRASSMITNNPKLADLLDDIMVENRQARDMANIYTDVIESTKDAFTSVINNNLNAVMKFLTAITVALAVPMIIMGTFGINYKLPWQDSPYGFVSAVILSVLLTVVSIVVMIRKKLF